MFKALYLFRVAFGDYFQLFSGCMAMCGPMCELSIGVIGIVVASCCLVY